MWFKKKVKEPNEIQLLLKEVGLSDLSTLIDNAYKLASMKNKAQLKKVLEYLKPQMLKALSEGKTYGETEKLPLKDYPYYYDTSSKENALLDEEGIRIHYTGDTIDWSKWTIDPKTEYKIFEPIPEEKQVAYLSFSLSKVK